MSEEKPYVQSEQAAGGTDKEEKQNLAASRARNRTVMLTPEMTGQVRALLYEQKEQQVVSDPLSQLLPPIDWGTAESRRPTGEREVAGHFLPGAAEEQPSFGEESLPYEESRPTGGMKRDAVRHPEGTAQPSSRKFTVNPNISGALYLQTPATGTEGVRAQQASYSRSTTSVAQTASSMSIRSSRAASRIVGFLVSFDADRNGEVFELRCGRWLLTSRPTDHGDYILVDDDSISPLHAIIRATDESKIQVLDQLSENGTGIIRLGQEEEEEVLGAMISVGHGDVLRFGTRHFVVCTVPSARVAKEKPEDDGPDED